MALNHARSQSLSFYAAFGEHPTRLNIERQFLLDHDQVVGLITWIFQLKRFAL